MTPRRLRRLFMCAWLLVPVAASASDRPAVFLHGFSAAPVDWSDAAERLRQRAAIEPHIPGLRWQTEFESQARDLQASPEYLGLPASTIVVGHSNGGLVAREWSKSHHLSGIVTIGTPHYGAPILTHLILWSAFSDGTRLALNRVLGAFSVPGNWWWVPSYLIDSLNFVADYSIWSVANLVSLLGLQQTIPVAYEMVPNSNYLRGLNSGSNLGRESVDVPGRVAIASAASNYFWAGPARAIAPAYADGIALGLYGAAGTLLFWGNYVLVNSSPADWTSIDQGLTLLSAAFQILTIDPIYCLAVSTPDMSACVPNDGILPINYQMYPGAPTVWLEGPAHTQERQQGEDALYHALVYIGVSSRNQTTPVPPPPPPGDSGDPGSDSAPSDGDGATTSGSGELQADQMLRPGDTLSSSSGDLHLTYQYDGNLVLYHDGVPLWGSGTDGRSAGVAIMQADGNFVVYDGEGVPRWASGTAGHPGAHLTVQNDGNVVIYDGGTPVWHTATFLQ